MRAKALKHNTPAAIRAVQPAGLTASSGPYRCTTNGILTLTGALACTVLDWRTFTYQNSTRGGPVIEQAWCNYPEPFELHDSRYVGGDRRERERIRRRCRNWKRELDRLPPLERQAILDEIRSS